MDIGVSSACFYPLETEKSLIRIGELGVKKTELFFNSPSELEKNFLNEICSIKDCYGIEIISMHPFMSFAEGFFIFSKYERRFKDSLELYKPMFNAAARIGAKYFVLHGAKNSLEISRDEYVERFYRFSETAKHYGVIVAQENVVDYVSQTPDFMSFMKNKLGEDFNAVLDVKQARRANENAYDFIDVLGKSIVHLHLSDCSGTENCLPPSPKGEFDFGKLFKKMHEIGYLGDAMVEVYRNNFKDDSQLIDAQKYLIRLEEAG